MRCKSQVYRVNKTNLTGRKSIALNKNFKDGRLGSTGHVVINNFESANAFALDQAKKLGGELVH